MLPLSDYTKTRIIHQTPSILPKWAIKVLATLVAAHEKRSVPLKSRYG